MVNAVKAASPPSVAVLICGSDSRMDILDRVLPSVLKFWPDCPYPIYVGLNKDHQVASNVTTLVAQPSEWRQECLAQIGQIPQSHLIVVLDDYLFQKPVEQNRLGHFVAMVIESHIAYLRLVPLGKSLLARLLDFRAAPDDLRIRAIKEDRPFYSGMQIAIWEKAHFALMLKRPGSIWEFEHQRIKGIEHYAITGRAPIRYRHLVDKGRWLPYARSLLKRVDLSADLGERPSWSAWMALRLALEKARLHVFGSVVN
jgi:hypothetical protein